MHEPESDSYRPLIQWARQEDLGSGDITSEATIPPDRQGQAHLVCRQAGVVCGLGVVREVLRCYDARLMLEPLATDGDRVAVGKAVGTISGPLRSLLSAERVLLNFLQRLSAIATLTDQYVRQVQGTSARICDTRKTTPGWRVLEKYAVCCGGGLNHRHGLYDACLIKDNHLASWRLADLRVGLERAIDALGCMPRKPDFIEVEVDTLEQLEIVLQVKGVDMILLDNMAPEQLHQAVMLRNQRVHDREVLLEASGGINLQTVRAVAESGVERISVGALTHSAASLDIALDMR